MFVNVKKKKTNNKWLKEKEGRKETELGDFRVSGWPRCYLNSSSDFLTRSSNHTRTTKTTKHSQISLFFIFFGPFFSFCTSDDYIATFFFGFWICFHVSDVFFLFSFFASRSLVCGNCERRWCHVSVPLRTRSENQCSITRQRALVSWSVPPCRLLLKGWGAGGAGGREREGHSDTKQFTV